MTLQAIQSVRVRLNGQVIRFDPGAVFSATPEQAQRLLARAPGRLRAITLPLDPPMEPIQPGWLVVYRDRGGQLRGGCDDRAHGTVRACAWNGSAWTVTLSNGEPLRLSAVLSVAHTDSAGRVVAAWMVREHGYDGMAGERPTPPSERASS